MAEVESFPMVNPDKNGMSCVACRIAFADQELYKQHYKTDWHRYNLKCRVAQLPPVTAEEFQKKVILHRNFGKAIEEDKQHTYCQVCKKSFSNKKAFENHINSKKHKDNEKYYEAHEVEEDNPTNPEISETESNMEVDSEIEELDSDEWDEESTNPIDNNDCIFCLHHSKSFLKSLEHMTNAHSFFIPDIEFCIDIQGLLTYLGEKVSEGFMCLWCNEKGRTFHSADAARSHMLDKGHCKMLHEGIALAEYADFYDYSSSYPDANEDVSPDEEVDIPEIDGTDYQLVLPSGITIGHRSLMRYYKQSINPNSTALVLKKNDKKLHKVLATYRSLGWTATQQEAAARKARDLHMMKRMQAKMGVKLNVKANKFQKHFRQQTNY